MTAMLSTGPDATHLTQQDMATMADGLSLGLANRFEIVRPLAVGGMATLFLLRHRLQHGLFVAKVLHPGLSGRQELVHAFRIEAIHAARLSGHPNIVPVLDIAELNGLFYMVMPYVEGEDLDHLLHRLGPLAEDEALLLGAQMASALAHLEANGIVHGDVGAGNIRLDRFGRYQLLDFGLSRSASEETSHLRSSGTPACTSPEQVRGEALDGRSDLYSLGVVMYEALLGRPLYRAATVEELLKMHLRGEWTDPPELTQRPGILALLRKLLQVDREQRFRSAYELAGALAALGCVLPEFRARPAISDPNRAMAESRKRRLSNA